MRGCFVAFVLLAAFAALVFAETDRCSQYGNCGDCAFNSPCGWSRAQGKCMSGLFEGSQDGSSSGSDWVYAYDLCAATPTPTPTPTGCEAASCNECTHLGGSLGAGCGWSKSQGKCMWGNAANSLDRTSSGADWAWTSDMCVESCPNMNVSTQGTVSTRRVGAATVYDVGLDGSATIVFSRQAPLLTIQLYPNTQFKLDDCVQPSGLAPNGDGALSFSDDGRVLRFSSEHGSIRGTINGGGDFIQRASPNDLSLNPLPAPGRFGKIAVLETKSEGSPDFVLEAALPNGRMRISTGIGYNEYSAEPSDTMVAQPPEDRSLRFDVLPPAEPGVQITVLSGVVIASDVATGGSRTMGVGERDFLTISDLAFLPTPEPTSTSEPTPEPGPTPCCAGFLLLFAGLAAVLLVVRPAS